MYRNHASRFVFTVEAIDFYLGNSWDMLVGFVLDWVCLLLLSMLPNTVLSAGWFSVLSEALQLTLTLRVSCKYRRARLVTYLIDSRLVRPMFEDAVACGNHVPTLSVLLRRFPELATKQTNERLRTLLHVAAALGWDHVVCHLFDTYHLESLGLNRRDIEGWQAWHTACLTAHESTCLAFISQKADDLPNPYEFLAQTTSNGETGLHILARNGSYHLITKIINTLLRDDQSHVDNREEAIGRLLQLGDKNNKTLLHLASEKGSTDFVCFLLAAGSDVLAVDSMGRTALYCAVESNFPDCVALLCQHDRLARASRSMGQGAASAPENENSNSPSSPSSNSSRSLSRSRTRTESGAGGAGRGRSGAAKAVKEAARGASLSLSLSPQRVPGESLLSAASLAELSGHYECLAILLADAQRAQA